MTMINKVKRQARHYLPFLMTFLYGNIVHASTTPGAPPIPEEEKIYNSLKTIDMKQIMDSTGASETHIRTHLQELPIFPFDDLKESLQKNPYINEYYNIYDVNDKISYITAYPLLTQLHTTESYMHAITGKTKTKKGSYIIPDMWESDLFWKLHAHLVAYFISEKFENLDLNPDKKKELIGDYAAFDKEDLPEKIQDELAILRNIRPNGKDMPWNSDYKFTFKYRESGKTNRHLHHTSTKKVSQTTSNKVKPSTLLIIIAPTSVIVGHFFMKNKAHKPSEEEEHTEHTDTPNQSGRGHIEETHTLK